MQGTILVADDEREIVDVIRLYGENEGFRVIGVHTGKEALDAVNTGSADIVLLDIMMPEMDGYAVIQAIRKSRNNVPVIFLSAKSNDHDKILGLGLGADDYITKPFNPLELLARVRAQLRRYYELGQAAEPAGRVTIGELSLDRSGCTAYRNDVPLTLTSMEYKLLAYLMENAGRVLTKVQIYDHVWGDAFVDDNTIMVHVSKLRDKIEPDPRQPIYLKTIRGLGYKFEKHVGTDSHGR